MNSTKPKQTVLVAHGSRDQQWADTFTHMTAKAIVARPNSVLAFMELNSPSIEDVVREANQQGIKYFEVLPLFLAKGKHLKTDIPNIIKSLEKELDIEVTLLDPIGEHPEIADAITKILEKTG